jgi:hypothetical protein
MQKYCEGKFGIDTSHLTKYLIFHNRLLKVLASCAGPCTF